MRQESLPTSEAQGTDRALQVYVLGTVDFESALALQRRLVYQVVGQPSEAALILCEHPPLITIGRQGSRAHILCEPGELRARQWAVRWVNRGGGCVLHTPGQLAIYPILALPEFGLGLQEYLDRLRSVVITLLADFSVVGEPCLKTGAVRVDGRPIATVGVAVRDWVAYYGVYLNVNPDLGPYRRVLCDASEGGVMTSLERERHGPLRPALVRERLLEHFAAGFGFTRTSLFFDHPALSRKAASDAITIRR